MKIIKLCIVTIFMVSQFSSVFAIKAPQLIEPNSRKTSLKPNFAWVTVKNATSYSVKIKELDDSTGAYSTVESDTTPSTDYRVTTTLTAGKYYKGIFKAIQSDNTKSDKETIYFQAEDKCLVLGHAKFQTNGTGGADALADTFTRENITFNILTQSTGSIWEAGANFILPNGSIIYKFEFTVVDNTASSSSVIFFRVGNDGSASQIGGLLSSASHQDANPTTFTYNVDLDTELDDATIDNVLYSYQANLLLGQDHSLYNVRIYYF